MLAGADECKRLRCMTSIGAADVDRVDGGVGGELFHRGVAMLTAVLLREGMRALGIA